MYVTAEFKQLLRTDPAVAARQNEILTDCRRRLAAGECECRFGDVVVTHRVRGVGDIVEALARRSGAKAVVEVVNGGPCIGCGERQANWNEKFPIRKKG